MLSLERAVRGRPLHPFEKVLNVVHAQAPNAKICFNSSPTDSA